MDILRIARLIEEIDFSGNTKQYKDYVIQRAVSDGTITADDADKLSAEYCTAERCENPWSYRYTIVYWDKLFDGDVPEAYNEIGCYDLASHWDWIRFYGEHMKITVHDNEYGVSYDTVTQEWD